MYIKFIFPVGTFCEVECRWGLLKTTITKDSRQHEIVPTMKTEEPLPNLYHNLNALT